MAWGGHFLNLFLNLRPQSTIKFGEILLLVGTKRTDQWKLCPKLEGPIAALPQIWWKWQKDAPVRLYSSFLQKSLSSCRCFDRHQVGFTNCILLNEIFDIVSRIYSLQIGHQCYLQSAPSVGINLNHDLEEGSYWSINFVLTNRSVSPNLMQMAKRRTSPAFFQLFAEITKLLSLFWQASVGVYEFYIAEWNFQHLQ